MSWLIETCPRLARARDQRCAEMDAERAERRKCREGLLRSENLVAHRDLQLQRAYVRGQRGYIIRREYKLKAAQDQLAYWTRRAGRAVA